jgi:hypothetical protein
MTIWRVTVHRAETVWGALGHAWDDASDTTAPVVEDGVRLNGVSLNGVSLIAVSQRAPAVRRRLVAESPDLVVAQGSSETGFF